jgi:hypothetical protein
VTSPRFDLLRYILLTWGRLDLSVAWRAWQDWTRLACFNVPSTGASCGTCTARGGVERVLLCYASELIARPVPPIHGFNF